MARKQIPELKHLDHILVSETAIKRRIAALSDQINRDYRGKHLTVIAVVNGAVVLVADLLRQIALPVRLDCIRASSYHTGTKAAGKPVVIDNLKLDIAGQHVLLVDDILDTGNTLSAVRELLMAKKAASVKTCVLLDKKARRVVPFEAEYVGIGVLKRRYYAGKL
jgi:hypoxanthine phosphoribosyltransferase